MGLDLITLALATKATDALLTSQSKIIVDTELEPFNPDEPAPTQFQTSEALVEGESYTIKIASGVYTSVCKKIAADEMEALYVGSPKLLVGEDTGEPFFFATVDAGPAIVALCADFNGGATMTVSQVTKTLDPKYLPAGSGGLPVVELTTTPTTEGVVLTEAEKAALLEVVTTGQLFAVKFNNSYGTITAVASVLVMQSVVFIISLWHEFGNFTIANDEDANVWKFFAN